MSIETPEQLEGLRRAGAVVAEVLRTLEAAVQPGVTTDALDAETMAARGARSGPIITYRYPRLGVPERRRRGRAPSTAGPIPRGR